MNFLTKLYHLQNDITLTARQIKPGFLTDTKPKVGTPIDEAKIGKYNRAQVTTALLTQGNERSESRRGIARGLEEVKNEHKKARLRIQTAEDPSSLFSKSSFLASFVSPKGAAGYQKESFVDNLKKYQIDLS